MNTVPPGAAFPVTVPSPIPRWRLALHLVARLLAATAVRCFWLIATPAGVALALLAIPQGREFYANELTLVSALALFIVSFLYCLLLGGLAAWLLLPRRQSSVASVIPVAWSFGAGLVMLAGPGSVAVIIAAAVPGALVPGLIVGISMICAGTAFTLAEAVRQRRRQQAWYLPVAYAAIATSAFVPIYFGRYALAVAIALLAYLCVHVLSAWHDRRPYLRSRRPDRRQGLDGLRFGVAPVIAGFVIAMGWNNAAEPAYSVGQALGPVATLLIAMSFCMAVMFLGVWAGDLVQHLAGLRRSDVARPKDPPSWGNRVLLVGVFALVLACALGNVAQAPVREMATEVALAARPSGTVESQLKARIAGLAAQAAPGAPLPMVIVAAEGGGVRAAYWTASVLGALSDRYDGFTGSVLAMSGVSGGSVGVTLYGALQHATLEHMACADGCARSYRAAAQAVAGSDFFSPSLLALLVSEPLRDLGFRHGTPDRAVALEEAFAANFQGVVGKPDLAADFCALQDNGGPLIFPGLTDATTGKRVVLSCHPREGTTIDITAPVWLAQGWRLRATTAAFLSARFPVVSPTGLFQADDHAFRFVDGGFSDNTGTGTAVELLGMVLAAAKDLGLADRVQPVLLVIHTAGTSQRVTHPWDNGVSGLLNDPLSTLDAVRSRNAGDYRRWLDGYAAAAGPHVHVVDWTLPDEASNPYPLGWLLSMSTQERIAAQVSASMIGPSAKQIEAATGWSVRPCDDKEPGLRSSCQEARSRGAN